MRRAFTIVELLIVIAVIGVLGTIVTNAALGAMKNARGKRADMMAAALEQGIAAYYAQEGKWPDVIETIARQSSTREDDTVLLSADQADQVFYQVVGKAFGKSGKKSVLVDATALFVARSRDLGNNGKGCYDNHGNPKKRTTYCAGRGCIPGVDFTTAVARSGRHHIRLQEMAYGYQGTEEARFCRFWIRYNVKLDSVTVSKEGPGL